MHPAVNTLAAVLTGLMAVAVVAVIFSQKAQTSNVLTSFGSAFGGILGVALSPITGSGGGYGSSGGGPFPTSGIGGGLIPLQ